MQVVRRPDEVAALVRQWRASGAEIAFVPTMGALHDGHLSLVERARRGNRRVIASIFVNPTQFGPNEDFARYPRNEQGDCEKLSSAGTDAVFFPAVTDIYPAGFQTWVEVEDLPRYLCGAERPGHFRGVSTVCARLFGIVRPDVAVFGEKDWQQLQVIRRMVQDLMLPLVVEGAPIVREPDGLAMSSRNAYLTPSERDRARCIFAALTAARSLVSQGERDSEVIERCMRSHLAEGGATVSYATVVQGDTLTHQAQVENPSRAAIAAHIGKTRLIDNAELL